MLMLNSIDPENKESLSGAFLANSKTLYLPSSPTLPINVKNGCNVNKERKFVYILAIIAMTPLKYKQNKERKQ